MQMLWWAVRALSP